MTMVLPMSISEVRDTCKACGAAVRWGHRQISTQGRQRRALFNTDDYDLHECDPGVKVFTEEEKRALEEKYRAEGRI